MIIHSTLALECWLVGVTISSLIIHRIFCQPHKKLKEEKPVQPVASVLDFPVEMDVGLRHNRPPSPEKDPYEFMENETSPTVSYRLLMKYTIDVDRDSHDHNNDNDKYIF